MKIQGLTRICWSWVIGSKGGDSKKYTARYGSLKSYLSFCKQFPEKLR